MRLVQQVQLSAIGYNNAIRCDRIQQDAMQYSAMGYNKMQCNTVH